jgi:hypothetical protein
VLLPCALIAALVMPAAASARVLAHVDAKSSTAKRKIPKSFLGFSAEINQTRSFVAVPGQKIASPIWLTMMRNLAAYGGGLPILRVGGGSGDRYYFPNGQPPPTGGSYKITYKWLAGVRAYLAASGAQIIFPINFGANRPDLAKQMAQLFVTYMPPGSIRALEIGSEPDTYPQIPYSATTTIRPKGYSPAKYLQELTNYANALGEVNPRPPFAGPGMIAQYKAWSKAFPTIVKQPIFSLITTHNYPVFACGKKLGTFRKVGPYELLRKDALEKIFPVLAKTARDAKKAHKPLRLTETNSVACGGAKGVSNTLASALWGTDWMFANWAAGLEGLNFHMASSRYTPFIPFRQAHSKAGVQVRPLYYAMLLFAEATAHRARLITSTLGASRATKGTLHVWATYDSVDHVVRVVIVNKSGKHGGSVDVRVPGAKGNGKVKRLTGHSVSSTEVTWGGQRFASPSYDGNLIGTRRLSLARRRHGSQFRIKMPKAGVALLTVPVRRR